MRRAVAGAEKLRSHVREISDGRADSVLEHRTRAKLRRHDLHPHPEPFPVVVGGGPCCSTSPSPYRVALGTEGLAYHSTPAQLAHDHERYNLLATTDWRILRIGWRDVEQDFDRIVRCLTELLAARGWRAGGEGSCTPNRPGDTGPGIGNAPAPVPAWVSATVPAPIPAWATASATAPAGPGTGRRQRGRRTPGWEEAAGKAS